MIMKSVDKETLKDLYAVLDGIPADRFVPDLSDLWQDRAGRRLNYPGKNHANNCGSLSCAAGWAYLSPRFYTKSEHKTPSYVSAFISYDWVRKFLCESAGITDAISVWADLFAARSDSRFDIMDTNRLTSKQLCLYRILRALGWSNRRALKRVQLDYYDHV